MRGGPSSVASLGLGHGESLEFSVRGECMRAFRDGESVQVRRQRLYLPGDVVVVRRRDHWNAHRFLGYAPSVHGLVALTQADDAAERDPAALASAIVGRAQCEVRASDRLAALGKYVRSMIRRVTQGAR
ncbi:MAG: hypothetical protein WBN10_15255 [Polyangiales bacterium]